VKRFQNKNLTYWTDDLDLEVFDVGETKIHINNTWKIAISEFYDGASIELWSFDTPESRAWTKTLGYGDVDPWTHFREHEILHTWISTKLEHPYSPTLWSVAHENEKFLHFGITTKKARGMEEWAVVKWQEFLNNPQVDLESGPFWWWTDRGHDLFALREEALKLLRVRK
jgi:hypothetical protein